MGLKPLEEKLAKELALTEPLSEARVVYTLVCVRKLLEIDDADLPSLKFHCDWALHTKLDREGAINIIKMFDDLEQHLEAGEPVKAERSKRKLHRVVSHEMFRKELGYFLKHHQLSTELADLSARWIPFWDFYMHVISDVPLEFTSTPIRNIRKVTIQRTDESFVPRELAPDFAFGVRWLAERFDRAPAQNHGLDYDIFKANPTPEI